MESANTRNIILPLVRLSLIYCLKLYIPVLATILSYTPMNSCGCKSFMHLRQIHSCRYLTLVSLSALLSVVWFETFRNDWICLNLGFVKKNLLPKVHEKSSSVNKYRLSLGNLTVPKYIKRPSNKQNSSEDNGVQVLARDDFCSLVASMQSFVKLQICSTEKQLEEST